MLCAAPGPPSSHSPSLAYSGPAPRQVLGQPGGSLGGSGGGGDDGGASPGHSQPEQSQWLATRKEQVRLLVSHSESHVEPCHTPSLGFT